MRLNFKYYIWLFFITIILTTHDITANMVYAKNDKLFLVSSEKSDLIEGINALRVLASKLHEKVDLSEEIQVIEDLDLQKYEIEITPYLTERIRDMLLRNELNYDGPNCWNAVLYFLKIIDNLRYVCEDEINYYLSESGLFTKTLFTQITFGSIEAGDIGAIYNGDEEIEHTFIHLTDKIILHKVGRLKHSKYKIDYLKEIMQRRYSKHHTCYYRCKSYDEVRNGLNSIKYHLLTIDEITENITQMLENTQSTEKTLDKKFLMQHVLAYSRFIPHLLRSSNNNFLKTIISYSWEGAVYNLARLIDTTTIIKCKTTAGLSYKGIITDISLNTKNKCILSLSDQEIDTSILDLQSIELEEDVSYRFLRNWTSLL